jgi:hypothetical protein
MNSNVMAVIAWRCSLLQHILGATEKTAAMQLPAVVLCAFRYFRYRYAGLLGAARGDGLYQMGRGRQIHIEVAGWNSYVCCLL